MGLLPYEVLSRYYQKLLYDNGYDCWTPALRDILKTSLIHDDLRHFSELGTDSSGLSVTRYDQGLTRTLPLIAYTYHTSKSKQR